MIGHKVKLCCVVIGLLVQYGRGQGQVLIPPTITGNPLFPLLFPLEKYYFTHESTLTLTCNASGNPEPDITWYKRGQFGEVRAVDLGFPYVEMLEDGRLRIEQMTVLDEGRYFCKAQSQVGDMLLGQAISTDATLIRATLGRFPPSRVQTYSVAEGEFLMLPCVRLKSVPEATYSWSLADSMEDESPERLTLNDRITTNPDGHLYFSHVKPEDSQRGRLYKCNVFNDVLDITVGGSYSEVIVTQNTSGNTDSPPILQYPRSTVGENGKVIALLGQDLDLKCIFSGKPTPEVLWNRVGGDLPQSAEYRRYAIEEHSTLLRLFDIHWEDEGQFQCIAGNYQGFSSYTFTVDVQSKPRFISDDAVHPGQVFRSRNMTEGETVSFYCEADPLTDPKPEVTLMINSVPVLDDPALNGMSRREVTEMSGRFGKVLTVYSACLDCPGGGTDRMTIQCKLSNIHGEVMKNVYLNVLPATTPAPLTTPRMTTPLPPVTPTPSESQGRIPAFSVYLSEDQVINNSALVFDEIITNVGLGYSEITGIFSPPVSGLYYLVSVVTSAYGSGFQFRIVKNGHDQLCRATTAVDSELGGTCVSVVELNISDSVYVSGVSADTWGTVRGQESSFSGYLIERFE